MNLEVYLRQLREDRDSILQSTWIGRKDCHLTKLQLQIIERNRMLLEYWKYEFMKEKDRIVILV